MFHCGSEIQFADHLLNGFQTAVEFQAIAWNSTAFFIPPPDSRSLVRIPMRILSYLWAGPNTMLAIGIGLLLIARFRIIDGVIEMHGPAVAWALKRLPVSPLAMTVGHAIFAQDAVALALTRKHEHVHVRQYARWGVFFIPAYLGCSAWLALRGRDGYMENPFEIEAYQVDNPSHR